MKLTTFKEEKKTNIDLSKISLESLPCGLFRANLGSACEELPEFSSLYVSAPVSNPYEWEIDLKIHMLMKDQYPCIPNWHCDNVPRIDGKLRYDLIKHDSQKMFLWISGGPYTEFIEQDTTIGHILKDHGEISQVIDNYEIPTRSMPEQTWISFNQNSPHRGTIAKGHTWRVFARLTHNSIAPTRPVVSVIRRHSQVYLDAKTFTW